MHKQVIKAGVPETAGPFNLCVRYGNLIFISGLPPFDEDYAAKLRDARASGLPIPPFPELPFERQVRIVMDHMKMLVEAAGSNMDCLLTIEATSAVPTPSPRARACRRGARRWIADSKSRRSASSPNDVGAKKTPGARAGGI
jgi:enamine deaminase RidA (YjgF/YER057c/UK114 family)